MNKNFSAYGLPEEVKFCKLCVNSNQKPNPVVEFKNNDNQKNGTFIDDNGICNVDKCIAYSNDGVCIPSNCPES